MYKKLANQDTISKSSTHGNVSMLRICFSLGLLMFIGTTQVTAKINTISPVYWDTPQGIARLNETQLNQQFTELVHYFITQENKAYCGPASAVMIANALHITSPVIPRLKPYSLWTQETIFTPQVIQAGITPKHVSRQGVTLDEETQLLNAIPGIKAIAYHASDKTADIRKQLITAVDTPGDYLLVNYYRPQLNQTGYGHLSVAAAYNKISDSILILDVARYKYPPFWVKIDQLIDAMNTFDKVSQKNRGFAVVRSVPVSKEKMDSKKHLED